MGAEWNDRMKPTTITTAVSPSKSTISQVMSQLGRMKSKKKAAASRANGQLSRKLDWSDVVMIKRRISAGESPEKIAPDYDCSSNTIRRVLKKWSL